MPDLNRKALFLAQLVKEAGQIKSEKKLAKMLCYIEKERGVATGYTFNKNHKFGNYTMEIKSEIKNLQNEGLIQFHIESTPVKNHQSHVFTATPKLKKTPLPLTEQEIRAVHSIFREYSSYYPSDIEMYDHAVYRNNKVRADMEMREQEQKKTRELIEKHSGNEEKALKEWLSD